MVIPIKETHPTDPSRRLRESLSFAVLRNDLAEKKRVERRKDRKTIGESSKLSRAVPSGAHCCIFLVFDPRKKSEQNEK